MFTLLFLFSIYRYEMKVFPLIQVFYFFLLLSCLLVVVGAWFSTQVVEPVVSSVILVERRSVNQRYVYVLCINDSLAVQLTRGRPTKSESQLSCNFRCCSDSLKFTFIFFQKVNKWRQNIFKEKFNFREILTGDPIFCQK